MESRTLVESYMSHTSWIFVSYSWKRTGKWGRNLKTTPPPRSRRCFTPPRKLKPLWNSWWGGGGGVFGRALSWRFLDQYYSVPDSCSRCSTRCSPKMPIFHSFKAFLALWLQAMLGYRLLYGVSNKHIIWSFKNSTNNSLVLKDQYCNYKW